MSLEAEFKKAADQAASLPSQPNEILLELYGLYKQSTIGDATGKRPGVFDVAGRAKHDAWAKRSGMSRDDAMLAYVDLVAKLAKD
jgi:acyl-CoA-binding protein